jgi:hypothetical protein
MFSEFLKFVFEKHNSCYCFFIDFLCFPSPRPMALRLETTRYSPRAPTSAPAGARLHLLANRAARRSDGRRPMMTKRAAPQWDGVDDRCAGRFSCRDGFDPARLPPRRERRRQASSQANAPRRGEGNFPGCKALKNHKMGKESHPSQVMETPIREVGDYDGSASPLLRRNRRLRGGASPARPERRGRVPLAAGSHMAGERNARARARKIFLAAKP